jgi:hypothetical protein
LAPPFSAPSTFAAGTSTLLNTELAGVAAAHAELVELLRDREALHPLLDQECR